MANTIHGATRGTGTWLCPTELDRARFVEMGRRHRWAHTAIGVTLVVVLTAAVPWIGFTPLFVMAGAMASALLAEWTAGRTSVPEVGVAVALAVLQLGVTISVHLSGGVHSPMLLWSLLFLPTAAARFPARVVVAGAGLSATSLVAVVFLHDAAEVVKDPTTILFTLGVMTVVASVSITMGSSDRAYRIGAVVDPLTGLLNRASLPERFEELAAQARLTGGGISVILCDVDHFKSVNDNHGHDRGDEVLQDVATEVRRSFRQFELIYRIGGEEFLVLLPGTALADACEAAGRIRHRVEVAQPGGLPLTISCGVAAAAGDALDFASLFAAADGALYEAKGQGRNRVVAAASVTAPMVSRPTVERRRSA